MECALCRAWIEYCMFICWSFNVSPMSHEKRRTNKKKYELPQSSNETVCVPMTCAVIALEIVCIFQIPLFDSMQKLHTNAQWKIKTVSIGVLAATAAAIAHNTFLSVDLSDDVDIDCLQIEIYKFSLSLPLSFRLSPFRCTISPALFVYIGIVDAFTHE